MAMSRSNHDKPFYVDVGTSIVAVRGASNHDVIVRYDHVRHPHTLDLAKEVCYKMNREVEVGRPRRNCDVGTADEQYERWRVFCGRYAPVCAGCPCESDRSLAYCFARWAQMPYEGGGKK